MELYIRQRLGAFNGLVRDSVLGSPTEFLLAVTALLQKKGFYYTPAHEYLEVAA